MEIYYGFPTSRNYEVITLSDKALEETDCTACTACHSCLAGQAAIVLMSRKYCWRCFEKAFGKTCALCQKLINGINQMNFIYYNNQVWHKECFKCCVCGKPLSNRAFNFRNNSVYCTICKKY